MTTPEARMRAGVDWLETIPGHWGMPPVRARFEVQLGKMLNPEAISGEHMRPYLRNFNVRWDRLDLSDVAQMSFDAADRQRLALRPGDLLVCEGGEVGRAAVWGGEIDDCYYQKALHRVRARSGDSTRFLMYSLMAAAWYGLFDSVGNTSTIVHLTAEKLRAHRLPWPPIEEQREIVAYLDAETARVDRMIDAIASANRLFTEWLRATVTQIIWGGSPSKAMLMHLTCSDRPIQYGIVLPGPDVDDGVPIVKGGNVVGGVLAAQGLSRTTREIESGFARSRLRATDIVFAIRGAVGACALVPSDVAGANITQDVAMVAPAAGVVPRWLLHALRSDPVQGEAASRTIGATIRGLNIRDLKRLAVPSIPVETQREQVRRLDAAQERHDRLTTARTRQIDLLLERRRALITAAVTGQVEIPGVAA